MCALYTVCVLAHVFTCNAACCVDITALGRTGAYTQQTGTIKVIPAILAMHKPSRTVRLSSKSKRGGGNRLVKQGMIEKLILPLPI